MRLLEISPAAIVCIEAAPRCVNIKPKKQNKRDPGPDGAGIESLHEGEESDRCRASKTKGDERRGLSVRQQHCQKEKSHPLGIIIMIPNLVRPEVLVLENRHKIIKIMGEVIVAAGGIQAFYDQQKGGGDESD